MEGREGEGRGLVTYSRRHEGLAAGETSMDIHENVMQLGSLQIGKGGWRDDK